MAARRTLGLALLAMLAVGWTSSGDDEVRAGYGHALAAGDVNGDGWADVVVGAPGFAAVALGQGRVYVHLGSELGPSEVAEWTFTGPAALGGNQHVGWAVAVGDVNGDGFADVLVGAPGPADSFCGDMGLTTPTCTGAVYGFLGAASGLASTPVWSATGGTIAGERFGTSIATGDVNNDGFDDVLVGADYFGGVPTSSFTGPGSAYLYLGAAGGIASDAAWSTSGDGVDRAELGESVALGDLDGDGHDDLIVGAPMRHARPAGGGRVLVYPGLASGAGATAAWTLSGAGSFGRVVAAGDVNGDARDDLLVSGSLAASTASVHLYLGSAAWPGDTPDGSWVTVGWPSVALAGDVDADGDDDVVLGDPSYAEGTRVLGRASLYLGGDVPLASTAAWSTVGEMAGSSFGSAVSSAGDVNGDAFADVLVGAEELTTANDDAGKAYLFFGADAPSGVCDPPGVVCDDRDPCSEASACHADGACVATSFAPAGAPCDDGDPATRDACDGAGACLGEALPVDGGHDAALPIDGGHDAGGDVLDGGVTPEDATASHCGCRAGSRDMPRLPLLLAMLLVTLARPRRSGSDPIAQLGRARLAGVGAGSTRRERLLGESEISEVSRGDLALRRRAGVPLNRGDRWARATKFRPRSERSWPRGSSRS